MKNIIKSIKNMKGMKSLIISGLVAISMLAGSVSVGTMTTTITGGMSYAHVVTEEVTPRAKPNKFKEYVLPRAKPSHLSGVITSRVVIDNPFPDLTGADSDKKIKDNPFPDLWSFKDKKLEDIMPDPDALESKDAKVAKKLLTREEVLALQIEKERERRANRAEKPKAPNKSEKVPGDIPLRPQMFVVNCGSEVVNGEHMLSKRWFEEGFDFLTDPLPTASGKTSWFILGNPDDGRWAVLNVSPLGTICIIAENKVGDGRVGL